jgi:hypothetical protein
MTDELIEAMARKLCDAAYGDAAFYDRYADHWRRAAKHAIALLKLADGSYERGAADMRERAASVIDYADALRDWDSAGLPITAAKVRALPLHPEPKE